MKCNGLKNILLKPRIKKPLDLRWHGQTYQSFANFPSETLPTNEKINNDDDNVSKSNDINGSNNDNENFNNFEEILKLTLGNYL